MSNIINENQNNIVYLDKPQQIVENIKTDKELIKINPKFKSIARGEISPNSPDYDVRFKKLLGIKTLEERRKIEEFKNKKNKVMELISEVSKLVKTLDFEELEKSYTINEKMNDIRITKKQYDAYCINMILEPKMLNSDYIEVYDLCFNYLNELKNKVEKCIENIKYGEECLRNNRNISKQVAQECINAEKKCIYNEIIKTCGKIIEIFCEKMAFFENKEKLNCKLNRIDEFFENRIDSIKKKEENELNKKFSDVNLLLAATQNSRDEIRELCQRLGIDKNSFNKKLKNKSVEELRKYTKEYLTIQPINDKYLKPFAFYFKCFINLKYEILKYEKQINAAKEFLNNGSKNEGIEKIEAENFIKEALKTIVKKVDETYKEIKIFFNKKISNFKNENRILKNLEARGKAMKKVNALKKNININIPKEMIKAIKEEQRNYKNYCNEKIKLNKLEGKYVEPSKIWFKNFEDLKKAAIDYKKNPGVVHKGEEIINDKINNTYRDTIEMLKKSMHIFGINDKCRAKLDSFLKFENLRNELNIGENSKDLLKEMVKEKMDYLGYRNEKIKSNEFKTEYEEPFTRYFMNFTNLKNDVLKYKEDIANKKNNIEEKQKEINEKIAKTYEKTKNMFKEYKQKFGFMENNNNDNN